MQLRRLPPVPIPGLRPIPLVGPTGSLLRFFRNPIRVLREIHRRFGTVAAISAGDPALVCALGPECNHQVLSNPELFHSAADLPIRIPDDSSLKRISSFLVGMNGEQHRRLRRTLMPLFQKSQLDGYRADMAAAAEAEISRWRVGETIDISKTMADLALGLSFRCLFGLDIGGGARDLADKALRFTEGATSPLLMLLPFDLPGSPYRNFLELCGQIEERMREIIRDRRGSQGVGRDALSSLIAVRDERGVALTDAQIVGFANELFIAGHETTASTLAWTLFLLDRHPKVLDDLQDELAGVAHGDTPTVEQIEQMPLLDAVVKESMRLLSATPFLFFRRLSEGMRVGAYDLPAGSALIISPIVTHHMPEIYPEPERFRPERWATAQPTPYEYLPFGAGPRTCLGASFASLSLRLVLAIIVQRFRLTLEAGADVSYQVRGVILGTRRGLPMRVGPSTKQRSSAPGALRGNIRELVELG